MHIFLNKLRGNSCAKGPFGVLCGKEWEKVVQFGIGSRSLNAIWKPDDQL